MLQYTRKQKTREHEAALNSTSHPDVIEPPRLPPLDKVQKRVKVVVASRGIVDWRETGEWLRQARGDDGEVGHGDLYARVLVRTLFYQASKTPRCDARVVSLGRGSDASGDGLNV